MKKFLLIVTAIMCSSVLHAADTVRFESGAYRITYPKEVYGYERVDDFDRFGVLQASLHKHSGEKTVEVSSKQIVKNDAKKDEPKKLTKKEKEKLAKAKQKAKKKALKEKEKAKKKALKEKQKAKKKALKAKKRK